MNSKSPHSLTISIGLAGMAVFCAAAQLQPTGVTDLTNRALSTVAGFCSAARPDADLTSRAVTALTTTNALATVRLGNGREATIEMDLQRNEVVCFSTFKNYLSKQYRTCQAQGGGRPLAFYPEPMLNRLGIKTDVLKLATKDTMRISQDSPQEVIRYFWRRQANGFCYKDDYVHLMFDSRDGELLGYRKKWGAQPSSLRVDVALANAKRIASQRLSGAGFSLEPKFESAELWIVTPNRYLAASQQDRCDSERRLAWVLVVSYQPDAHTGKEIWVSADTGEILGGLDIR